MGLNSFSELKRHLMNSVFVEGQFISNLLIEYT